MQLKRAAITGIAGWVPENRLTNQDLEKMVDTNDEWIRTRTGINERRILNEKGKGTSDIAVPAVLDLLKKTNTAPEEVDLLICATSTPDMQFPATANVICDKIGIKNAFGYDINAACSGFLYSLVTASKFIETGTYKKIIVVGADKMSSIINYQDRTTCIIFGDGGGAVMLEPSKDDSGIYDSILESDGSGRHYLFQKSGGSVSPATPESVAAREHFVTQEGAHVFKAAVKNLSSSMDRVMKRNNLTSDDIAWFIPHQANLRIIKAAAAYIGLDEKKVAVNISKYGNTTNGTIPLCLWEWESKFKKGDNLILGAFGGGFTWGAVYLKWAYDAPNS